MNSKYKQVLIFLSFLTLAFSFPLQVLFFSPYPALVPYLFLGALFCVALIEEGWSLKIWNTKRNIILNIYLFLVLGHTLFQLLSDLITLDQAASAIIIFAFPILYYIYFYYHATESQIRSGLSAIFISGLVIGILFIIDSYLMLVLGRVSEYSYAAMDYVYLRSSSEDGIENVARISPFGRSHGLLEKHSISSSWIAFSCLSILSLFNFNKIYIILISLIYAIILTICLNTTSLAAFLLTIFILIRLEYSIKNIFFVASMVLSIIIIIFLIDINLFNIIKSQFETQISIIFDEENIGIPGKTYFGNLLNEIISYPNKAIDYPFGLFFGDGFSEPGYPKGGDYGLVESLHRFGPTMFFFIYAGLFSLIFKARKYFKKIYSSPHSYINYFWFSVCILLYIVISELHYSIWYAKSIFPIFFMSLALFERFKINIRDIAH